MGDRRFTFVVVTHYDLKKALAALVNLYHYWAFDTRKAAAFDRKGNPRRLRKIPELERLLASW